jgi:hypothetical protein
MLHIFLLSSKWNVKKNNFSGVLSVIVYKKKVARELVNDIPVFSKFSLHIAMWFNFIHFYYHVLIVLWYDCFQSIHHNNSHSPVIKWVFIMRKFLGHGILLRVNFYDLIGLWENLLLLALFCGKFLIKDTFCRILQIIELGSGMF